MLGGAGTISLIAGTTAGLEPFFALAYTRHVLGHDYREANPLFVQRAIEHGVWSGSHADAVTTTGTRRHRYDLPDDLRRGFVTALEIAPEWHIRMQAAVQRHTDAAVAKTVNLPDEASIDDVQDTFWRAWRAKTKGITVYRTGSRPRPSPLPPRPPSARPARRPHPRRLHRRSADPHRPPGGVTPLARRRSQDSIR